MDYILELDRSFFIWLNAFHAPAMDTFMLFVTRKQSWYLLYLFIIFGILKEDLKNGFRKIVLIAVSVLFSDQFCSGFLKPFVQRLRPCYAPDLQSIGHFIGDCGGQYGFASSHAANCFALALMLLLFYRKNKVIMSMFFIWAVLVAYSRIYVGVHYPLDILVGSAIGIFFSWSFFNISIRYSFIIKSQTNKTSFL